MYDEPMKLEIYEKPALDVGEEDIRIQNILEALKKSGLSVYRYDLFANPDEFSSNKALQELLDREGIDALPVFFMDDFLIHWGDYPENKVIQKWFQLNCEGYNCKEGCDIERQGICQGCMGHKAG